MSSHVSLAPSTVASASGAVFFNDAVTAAVQIKATRGQIYLLDLMNGTAATAYLQIFYLPAASVTLGTTVADFTIKLPTNAGSGFVKTIPFPVPVGGVSSVAGRTPSGLTIAGTTSATGSATAAIGVSAVYL